MNELAEATPFLDCLKQYDCTLSIRFAGGSYWITMTTNGVNRAGNANTRTMEIKDADMPIYNFLAIGRLMDKIAAICAELHNTLTHA